MDEKEVDPGDDTDSNRKKDETARMRGGAPRATSMESLATPAARVGELGRREKNGERSEMQPLLRQRVPDAVAPWSRSHCTNQRAVRGWTDTSDIARSTMAGGEGGRAEPKKKNIERSETKHFAPITRAQTPKTYPEFAAATISVLAREEATPEVSLVVPWLTTGAGELREKKYQRSGTKHLHQ